MASTLPKGKKRFTLRIVLPYLILALGSSFTFLVSFYFSKLSAAQDQSRFTKSVQEVNDEIRARLQTSIALLRAGTGLFAASDYVDKDEFAHFVQQIELQKNYPGIQGIGFSQRLRPDERTALVERMKHDGFPDFKIWPDTPRSEYNTIVYLQPMNNRNHLAIGFDMATEAVRRQAMDGARDSGTPVASGRVVLVQEPTTQQQYGFLIYAPVYRNGADVSTVKARQDALFGFVYSPFRVDDFIAPVLNEKDLDVSFKIYDGNEVKPETLLHDSPAETKPELTKQTTIDFAGRSWTLVYATKPSFEHSSSRTVVPYIFAAGLLLSWLFFGVTRAQIHARARAVCCQ
jgi:CHASE1-domain containing sensor protein